MEVSPETTLAVILGAHEWPEAELGGGPSYQNSAQAIRSYLLDERGFGLPKDQLLDLFASEESAPKQLREIKAFLQGKNQGRKAKDLLLYYVGHGLFSQRGEAFLLAIRDTETDMREATSIRMRDLAQCLKQNARFQRRFLVLDCCFAAAATTEFQSEQMQTAMRKTAEALPTKGTLILCSVNKDDPSLAPKDQQYTMFSGAFYEALTTGGSNMGDYLSMEDVKSLAWKSIREKYEERAVRPELHCPEQKEGNLSGLAIFPNPAKGKARRVPNFRIKKVPQYGTIKIWSSGGGQLYLNEEKPTELDSGHTSIIEELKAGYHGIRIESEGFEPVEADVLLKPNQVLDLTYEPKKMRGPIPSPTSKRRENSKAEMARKAGEETIFHLAKGVDLKMVWVPPGKFQMGSPESEEGRWEGETQYEVEITKGYWLGKYPVTQGQWTAIMGNNPSHFKGENRPVEKVSWHDAQEMIKKLNEQIKEAGKFALPTEAEWEYACRAGTTGPYAGELGKMGWYDKNSGRETHPVGEKEGNGWGLHDMHGNVWEWCEDRYGDYPSGKVVDPRGPDSGSSRVVRGGSWSLEARYCRSAYRIRIVPGVRYYDLGFRLLRTAL